MVALPEEPPTSVPPGEVLADVEVSFPLADLTVGALRTLLALYDKQRATATEPVLLRFDQHGDVDGLSVLLCAPVDALLGLDS